MDKSENNIKRFSFYRARYPVSTPRIKSCNHCSSCIRIHNIEETEATPLLATAASVTYSRTASCYEQILLAIFSLIIVFSISLGVYLIIITREGPIIEEFDFVSRETWVPNYNATYLKNLKSMKTPVSKILLVPLNDECISDPKYCLEFLEYSEQDKRKLHIFNGEISYNFYVDQRGRIYEGRSFHFQSNCDDPSDACDDILAIAIIIDKRSSSSDDDDAPIITQSQIKKLKVFLDYAIMDKDLVPCFQILVHPKTSDHIAKLASKLFHHEKKNYCILS